MSIPGVQMDWFGCFEEYKLGAQVSQVPQWVWRTLP